MEHGARSANRDPHGHPPDGAADAPAEESGHSMWWMVACCAPMVLIAVALLLGLFGPS